MVGRWTFHISFSSDRRAIFPNEATHPLILPQVSRSFATRSDSSTPSTARPGGSTNTGWAHKDPHDGRPYSRPLCRRPERAQPPPARDVRRSCGTESDALRRPLLAAGCAKSTPSAAGPHSPNGRMRDDRAQASRQTGKVKSSHHYQQGIVSIHGLSACMITRHTAVSVRSPHTLTLWIIRPSGVRTAAGSGRSRCGASAGSIASWSHVARACTCSPGVIRGS